MSGGTLREAVERIADEAGTCFTAGAAQMRVELRKALAEHPEGGVAPEHEGMQKAADLVEGLRVHIDADPYSTCPDGCGWFNYAAMKIREAAAGQP